MLLIIKGDATPSLYNLGEPSSNFGSIKDCEGLLKESMNASVPLLAEREIIVNFELLEIFMFQIPSNTSPLS